MSGQNTHINQFIIQRSDLEGRWEPEYYAPEIKQLEDKIRNKTHKKLKDYMIKMASGATPSVQEVEKHYSDAINGIPFLRVQNLQTNGELALDDVKYINRKTHETSLKRSRVTEGDLLVKITGVGRMAIASVAPNGFEGNTNQHMVVIKTDDKEISKYLAKYLNLDVSEKLASRRTTGGTRPALDFPALRSLPIVENIDFSILEKAHKVKQLKEKEAQKLLDSIDTYLLNELGITLPKKENNLESRMFPVQFSEVSGDRIDPLLYDTYTKELRQAISNVDPMKFKTICLSDYIIQSLTGDWGLDSINEEGYTKCLVIRATEFDNDYNLNLDNARVKYRYIKNEKFKKIDISEGDILIEKSGGSPDQPVGRVSIITNNILNSHKICYSNFIQKIKVDKNSIVPLYLFSFLKMTHNLKLTEAMQSQTNGIRNLIMRTYLKQNIVVPIKINGDIDIDKQTEIASHIGELREKAKRLQEEAEVVLNHAKTTIEKIILN